MVLAFYKSTENENFSYYYLHDYQQNLFTTFGFTILWGKGFETGRKKEYMFDSRQEMDHKIRDILLARIKEDYKLVYSYPHLNSYVKLFNEFDKEYHPAAI